MSSVIRTADQSPVPVADRRWLALSVIAVAQLMVALDATIVSIALPWAQRSLGASDADRQWVITAYTLAFGGLLLTGGRIADRLGRKRAFLVGLTGFGLASAIGGSAVSFWMLLAARAAQGAFAALLAPTALSLLAVTFREPRERARAFALYGAIAGSGAAVGLLLGGVLTQYLSWRWCLYVNVPIAVAAMAGGWRVLSGGRPRTGQRLDLPGILLASGTLAGLVYACSRAVTEGWKSASVVLLLSVSGVLLIGFIVREARATVPLLPLRIVLDRNRGGAYLSVGLTIAAMFGAFLFLTYYLQVVLRYPPIEAGVGFLPLTLASQAGSWGIASVLMPRVPTRLVMAPGALIAAVGMLVLSQIPASNGYLAHVLPAEILIGVGVACVMAPAFNVATLGIDPKEAGVAAATVNAASQVGASVGTALLNTIAAAATAAYLVSQPSASVHLGAALVHGYSAATVWASISLLGAGIISLLLIDAGKQAKH
jgi:EmrB/QacA subfamily drug resistance transporter